jgi:hypothetical protein
MGSYNKCSYFSSSCCSSSSSRRLDELGFPIATQVCCLSHEGGREGMTRKREVVVGF